MRKKKKIKVKQSRYHCGNCNKKRYESEMDLLPIPNKNNMYTAFCKTGQCHTVALLRMTQRKRILKKQHQEICNYLQLKIEL